jgi:UDP-3-O-[3-hydroxymyristoyl] N-acetylglucosamine deacetylase
VAYQRTIKNSTTFTGVGLHSGKEIRMTLRPADSGTGIVFHRVDLTPAVSIEAVSANVVNTRLSTTIGKPGGVVSTIEHLMAALFAFGIDNVHIDITGPEVPIMDGSAAPFAEGIRSAGITLLQRSKKFLVVKKPVTVIDGDKKISVIPSRYYRISFGLSFSHPAVSSQFRSLKYADQTFLRDYAAARTFGFLAEVETLKANGLARGGSLENAVVIGDAGVLNPEGLRFRDEFVRHKIMDAVGDLSLAGYAIIGHVKAVKSGHDLNHRLVQELLSRRDAWELVEQEDAAPAVFGLPFQGFALSKA